MNNWIVTADDIGEILGVQKRQVYNLVKQGLPQASKGKFHVPTVVKWFIDTRTGENAADITEQRKMLYKSQTDKIELENAKLRGDLLNCGAVQTAFFELGTRVRTQIEAIEPRLARILPSDVVIEFRAEIKAALEAISDDVAAFADSRDDSADSPAST